MKCFRAAVFGASGGIGAALVAKLEASGAYCEIYAGARTLPVCGLPFTFDLTDEASIARAVAGIGAGGPLDLVIVATGRLHGEGSPMPEKSWRALDGAALAEMFAINAIGPALIAKHMLPLLRREGRAVFAALSARVGSIGDNRLGGWHGYRASKAALNMLMRNFAIELAAHNPQAIVAGVHPGTVDTALSRPFQRGVTPGKLLTPAQSAGHILSVLAGLEPKDSGGLFAWSGEQLPF